MEYVESHHVMVECIILFLRFFFICLILKELFQCSSGPRIFFSYDIFVHGSKFQFIDGINLNLTHVCVCCEIIFVFTYIALVVFVYKVKHEKIIQ